MKTILFLFALLMIIGIALFFKHRSDNGKKIGIDINSPRVKTRWDSILTGKWKISDTAWNKEEQWNVSADIEFFGDHQYRYNATEEYFHSVNAVQQSDVNLRVGGGSNGTWYANDNNSFTLFSKECSFVTSKVGRDEYENKAKTLICKDGFILRYGFISNMNCRSEIKLLKKDSIIVSGKTYSDGCNTYTTLYKAD